MRFAVAKAITPAHSKYWGSRKNEANGKDLAPILVAPSWVSTNRTFSDVSLAAKFPQDRQNWLSRTSTHNQVVAIMCFQGTIRRGEGSSKCLQITVFEPLFSSKSCQNLR
jgi:hypothetical protein